MLDYGSTGTAPALARGPSRAWLSLALLLAATLVAVPAYTGLPNQALVIAYRFGLPLAWAILGVAAGVAAGVASGAASGAAAAKAERLAWTRPVLWSLFGVSLGFALTYLVGDWPIVRFGLSTATPFGAAMVKLSEAVPMYAAILLAAYLGKQSLSDLSLRLGRFWLSVGLGLVATVPLVGMVLLDPAGDIKTLATVPVATVLSWLPWIGLFSVANGFMEELWYRGSWFGAFRRALGPSAAMHVTSLAFCLMHVLIYWNQPMTMLMLTPVWLYLGYACAFIVRKTGSLWGAVLTHTLADALFLLVAFGSRGGL